MITGLRPVWVVAIMLCAFSAIGASAKGAAPVEEHIDSLAATTRIIQIGEKSVTQAELDSMRRVISIYYYDQFRHSQDPDAPFFMFMSKNAQMMMGIGGVVRMRGWYDWGGALPVNAFAPSLIQIPADPTNERRFGTTPAGTALFFSVIGHHNKIGEYSLYIEANFNGYNQRGLYLKKAYAQVRDFTVGLAPSTFSDPAALPPTVDAQGSTNKLASNNVLMRYMPTFKKFSVGVSVETPDNTVSADGVATAKRTNWYPDFAAMVQYQWARGQHVRLSGVIRGLGYRNLIEERNVEKVGWGVQLSSVSRPIPQLTTYLTFNCGSGYGSLCNDLIAVSNDLIGIPGDPGNLYAPFAFGYCVGLQWNFRPNLFSTVQFSQTRLLPQHEISPDSYKYGYCITANLFWNPIERIQVGAEFDFGKRQNFSRIHGYARRIGALVQFSF